MRLTKDEIEQILKDLENIKNYGAYMDCKNPFKPKISPEVYKKFMENKNVGESIKVDEIKWTNLKCDLPECDEEFVMGFRDDYLNKVFCCMNHYIRYVVRQEIKNMKKKCKDCDKR